MARGPRGAIRRWGPRVVGLSVAVWLLLGVVLLVRLDLQGRWRRSSLLERQEAEEPLALVLDLARQPVRAPEVASPSQQAVALQQALGEPTSGSAGSSAPGGSSQPHDGGSEFPGGGQKDGSRSSDGLPAPSLNATSPSLAPAASFVDRRVSGLGPTLDDATLHGGWQLTREVFERSAAHPNATLISPASPRLVLIRSFLSPGEVDHLVSLAEGEPAPPTPAGRPSWHWSSPELRAYHLPAPLFPPFSPSAPACPHPGHLERSEVVSDEVSRHEARTSFGAWLNGPRRDDAVRAVQHRIHGAVGIPEEFGERWAAGPGLEEGRRGLRDAQGKKHALLLCLKLHQ